MTSYLPPLNYNTDIFNVGDYNYQDSYISYYTGDKRYSKLNGMNTFTQLCNFNGGIYATSIFENGINISLKYAPIDNANLTGTPICPNADGTITDQIANVNYVNDSIANIEFPTTDLNNYMDLTSSQVSAGVKTFSDLPLISATIPPNSEDTSIVTSFWVKQQGYVEGIELDNYLLEWYLSKAEGISIYAPKESPVFTTQITTPVLILNGTNLATTLTNINSNITLKANIASPVFTTQITTPKVILGSSDLQGLLDLKSPINSPSFTGIPVAPNALLTDTSTQIATTKFVKDQAYLTNSLLSSSLSNYSGVINSGNYTLRNVAENFGIISVGTFTSPSFFGQSIKLKIYSHNGYNGFNSQDYVCEIFFKLSNASYGGGDVFEFPANSWYYRYGANTTNPYPAWLITNNNRLSFTLYINTFFYNTFSFYEVSYSTGCTWTNDESYFNSSLPTTNFPILYSLDGYILQSPLIIKGTTEAPTPLTNDNSTQIATTKFVKDQGYASLTSPTFTTQITTPKIILGSTDLQTTLNTKISNLSIGTVTSLPYGSVPSITIDTTNPLIPKFNFNIITGDRGEKGDQGDPGENVSAGEILAIISTALGGISIVVLYGYVTALQGQVLALETSVGILQTEVGSLVIKTTGLTYTANKSNFSHDLSIGLNAVILSATGTNYFIRNIQTSANLISKGITIYDNVDTGTIKASIDNGGNISVNNLTATGDIISIGTSTSSQTYLQGTNIQIGASSSSASLPTISIGKLNASTVNIHGEVNIAIDETNPLSNINIGNGTNPVNIKSNIVQTGTTTTTLKDTTVKSLSLPNGNISQTLGSNTLRGTTINGNITQTYTTTNTANGETTEFITTLLATTVKSLSLANGNIQQTLGTSSLYNLTVANDVNLNGTLINIGDNNENNVINIGNSQSTVTIEGDAISIGVGSVANIINIGNNFTTLTLKSTSNQPINIDNAMNQFQQEFDADIQQILNEINSF